MKYIIAEETSTARTISCVITGPRVFRGLARNSKFNETALETGTLIFKEGIPRRGHEVHLKDLPLKTYKVIQRAEEEDDTLTLYMDELSHIVSSLAFLVEQEYPVMNLKPAAVKIYDYYEKDEYAIVEYNSPCTWF
ncbi:alpha-2-macroglobulin-P-like [Bufo gargarizans]|uniref:alpha-2-macroglobulin-P-like n=1 Tax=Bufo gargarizans TaxID=30331 RepID=UPI001CF2076C|nr:alpha-2-macroglobulin-P-like [Bufo gargarizans]